ncbi:hypothetical protein C8R47DRAFT_1111333 [Mycena vitilis]|nr:hypothetical protein C8R47DRAFT_1111333 [Mycena vitilis]
MQSNMAPQPIAPPSQPITPASQPIAPTSQPTAPPSQPTVQPSTSPDATRPLNTIDALRYLALVQSQTAPEVYNRFLDIMKDFKSQIINELGVNQCGVNRLIKRISQLFHDYPALIEGLNIFLPAGYSIAVSEDPLVEHIINVPAPMQFRVTHAKAYKKYAKKVKARYASNPKTYKTYKRFLEIMAAHQNEELQNVCAILVLLSADSCFAGPGV